MTQLSSGVLVLFSAVAFGIRMGGPLWELVHQLRRLADSDVRKAREVAVRIALAAAARQSIDFSDDKPGVDDRGQGTFDDY